MLVLDVPLPAVTARKLIFLLTRACFLVAPSAKGATQLGCGMYGGVADQWDICKWVFLIDDKFVDL
jgi:hypothetical protein